MSDYKYKEQPPCIKFFFGERETFSLEHRFFNSASFLSALATIFAITTNIILKLNIYSTILTLVSFIIFSACYYISRVRNTYKKLIIPYIIYSVIFLSIVWFLNGGSQGSIIFIYLLVLIIFIIISNKNKLLIISLFLLNLGFLFTIEVLYPNSVVYYKNATTQFYDISISSIFSFILISLMISVLLNNYKEERSLNIHQHNKLILQRSQITDSIHYIKGLQTALFSESILSKTLPNHFIYYKPKDIVGGDFYWTKQINQKTIIAIADCTGHGISGAFMSIMGLSLLNEITQRKEDLKANQILEIFRYELKELLNPIDNKYSKTSAIDITLCIINHSKKILQYAGANIPLYLIRDNKLMEYRPTRNSIGIIPIEIPFLNNEIEYHNNDIFYLFSDGFIDQPSCDRNKKFGKKRFNDLLLEIHQKPLIIQKELIDLNIRKWMGNSSQIDDMVILGFKL
ncbi:MAG: SpoIIE family protein phosphatase [Bacteroidales bacterium]|nr:SpoIIE family protein phosphatase [Bacteroidales bacterium]